MSLSRADSDWSVVGTGGTITGISEYLLTRVPELLVVLADPQGSGLYNSIKYGVMYSSTEREGTRRRHQVDSLVEGIGLNRLTRNFAKGQGRIHEAVKVTDAMAVAMSRWLVQNDGSPAPPPNPRYLSSPRPLVRADIVRSFCWIEFVCELVCCGAYRTTTRTRSSNCNHVM